MNTATHFSIDLETLSTDRRAVILAIAIVADNGAELLLHPDIDQQLRAGRTVDGDTITWWLKQSDGARKSIYLHHPQPCRTVADTLTLFIKDQHSADGFHVWGNSPSFDCEILASFLEDCGEHDRPWPWHAERDVRTARMVLPDRTQPTIAHSALDDARAQLQDIMRFLVLAGGIKDGSLPCPPPPPVLPQRGEDAAD